MNIKPKTVQQKPIEKKWEKPMDLSSYVDVPSCEITVGKYAGKTWAWVQKNDSSYSQWMKDSGTCVQWGCMVLPEQKEAKKWSGYVDDYGHRWVGISVYDRATTPADPSWYQ